jgi:hypothetical protein
VLNLNGACAENLIHVDDVMESPKAGEMIGLFCFVVATLGSPARRATRRNVIAELVMNDTMRSR